jgi:hypothetical protein
MQEDPPDLLDHEGQRLDCRGTPLARRLASTWTSPANIRPPNVLRARGYFAGLSSVTASAWA